MSTHIIAIVEPIEQKQALNYTTIIFNKMSPDAIFATSATSLYPSAAPVTQKIHHHHRRARGALLRVGPPALAAGPVRARQVDVAAHVDEGLAAARLRRRAATHQGPCGGARGHC